MHEEHRKRLRARFLAEGLDSFEPHNVLELLLFYSIPQKDTNEIAHRLIDRFGSVSAVLDADINELTEVNGIGEYSAVFLKLLPQVTRRYLREKHDEYPIYNTARKIGLFLLPLFIGRNVETVYILLMNASYEILSCEILYEGSVNSAHLSSRSVIERAISTHASMVVLAHNHPGGLAIPSSADLGTTHAIYQALELIDVLLLEHYVIAGDKYSPIIFSHMKSLRQCNDGSELQHFYSEI